MNNIARIASLTLALLGANSWAQDATLSAAAKEDGAVTLSLIHI